MTAEVAILNKQSVAMAADSAVTVGDQKIFNTVNKLFALSKSEPVGIMVYSSAEIMEVPVETVVKEFRRQRGPESCENLDGYVEAFESFLRTDNSIFSDAARIRALASASWQVSTSLVRLAGWILDNNLKNAPIWGHPTRAEAQSALQEAIVDFEERARQSPAIPVTSRTQTRRVVRAAIEGDLREMTHWIGESFPVTAKITGRIHRLVVDYLFRQTGLGGETGIVIAGFGTKEIFPHLRSLEFQCSALGLHKAPRRVKYDIESFPPTKSAVIIPFAQADVMAAFVEGRDPTYDRVLTSFMEAFTAERAELLRRATPSQIPEADLIERFGGELVNAVQKKLRDHAQEAFVSPTVQVVASMPKEELAILAEALVDVTALKRKASRDSETVGGPTDVAVISKGDGFIWIKRKHYFDPRLNPAFCAQYLEQQ